MLLTKVCRHVKTPPKIFRGTSLRSVILKFFDVELDAPSDPDLNRMLVSEPNGEIPRNFAVLTKSSADETKAPTAVRTTCKTDEPRTSAATDLKRSNARLFSQERFSPQKHHIAPVRCILVHFGV